MRTFFINCIALMGWLAAVAWPSEVRASGDGTSDLPATQNERLLSIGDAFVQAGNNEKALKLFNEGFEASTTPMEKWNAADRIASIYIQEEKYKDALGRFNSLINQPDVRRDSTVMINIYGRMGQLYYDMKEYVKSIKTYNILKEYMKGNTDRELRVHLQSNMAKTQMVAGDIVEASRLLDLAENGATELFLDDVLADVYESKAYLCERKGDYQSAYAYKEKQLKVESEMWQRERANIVNSKSPWTYYQRAEVTVNSERKIKELEEKLADAQARIMDAGKYDMVYAGIFVSLLLVIAFVFLYGYRRDKRASQLSQSNIEKKRVMSIVAHDFMSPFNALIGFAELQMQYAQAQEDKEMLYYSRTIYNSAQTLFQMVGNVLAWSQIDGQMKAKRRTLNVASEVENIVSIYKLMADDKGVHINVSVDETVEAVADPNHFNIVVRNVLSNALKFTPKGGRISISGLTYGNETSIIIDDSGVGMSQDVVKKINNSQSVESTYGTSQEKGTGLGLAICRDLMTANNGKFEVTSVEGRGSSFTMVFDSNE